ncbi:VOC family protein [Halocatena marina]|uniref:VOC family protein n=1 Tax=Halocatena marina TaxID=2934937 RepID=A0ABD5YYG9_9EURY|nr:VOC family protein [Halocatena marina]
MNAQADDFVINTDTDLSESVSFYRNTLGLELEMLSEEGGFAEFALPPTTLALGEADPQMLVSPGEGGTSVAMAVDDVEAATEELRNDGTHGRVDQFP